MAAPIDQTQQKTVKFESISSIYFCTLASYSPYGEVYVPINFKYVLTKVISD